MVHSRLSNGLPIKKRFQSFCMRHEFFSKCEFHLRVDRLLRLTIAITSVDGFCVETFVPSGGIVVQQTARADDATLASLRHEQDGSAFAQVLVRTRKIEADIWNRRFGGLEFDTQHVTILDTNQSGHQVLLGGTIHISPLSSEGRVQPHPRATIIFVTPI